MTSYLAINQIRLKKTEIHIFYFYSRETPSDEMVQTWAAVATCTASWFRLSGEEAGPGKAPTLTESLPLCQALLQLVHALFMFV